MTTRDEPAERAYAVFARYSRSLSHVTADEAPSCRTQKARLEATKLRDLTARDLEYSCWIDDDRGFKHFLPRMLQLTLDAHGFDTFYIAQQLNRFALADWPADERAVVADWYAERFRAPLSRGESPHDELREQAIACESVQPLLRIWDEDSSRSALVSLARFLIDDWKDFEPRLKLLHFRRPLVVAIEQLRDWLRSPAVKARLEAAYLAAPDAPDAELLAAAVDWLSTLV